MWEEYVKGNVRQPKRGGHYAKTLISVSHSEPARNKPIIEGRCAGVKTRLFLDSGAELNVIDHEFVRDMIRQQLPVKFTAATSQVQCANGSKMSVVGYVSFSVQMGCSTVIQRFSVVRGLFPKVIVGIRTMKTLGIVLDPAKNGILVNGNVRVPFVSKIFPGTVFETMGNGDGLSQGADESPRM